MRVRSLPHSHRNIIVIAVVVAVCAAGWIVLSSRTQSVHFAEPRRAGAATELSKFNPAQVYQDRVNGTATIEATIGQSPSGGTGFVVDSDGYLLTSSHVVHDYATGTDASNIFVEFPNHARVPAQLRGIDKFSDVALLKVDPAAAGKLSPLPLGDSDQTIVGEPLAVIGAPFGNASSLSTGIVSSIRTVDSEINQTSRIAGAIQTDAAINKGNSGGPIFNAQGDVIAIAQQIKSPSGTSAGVGFGIPINTARRSMEQIKASGSVQYSWLGLTTWTMTPQFSRQYGVGPTHGVIVEKALGPAADAGIRGGTRQVTFMGERVAFGDLITSIAGLPVRSSDDVTRIASRLNPGDQIDVTVYRDGHEMHVNLTSAEKL